MNQCYQNGRHEHIDHGPAADVLDHAIEMCSVPGAPTPAPVYRDHQKGQAHELQHWNDNAGKENQDSDLPHSRGDEFLHSTQDRVGFLVSEELDDQNRIVVGRDVEE